MSSAFVVANLPSTSGIPRKKYNEITTNNKLTNKKSHFGKKYRHLHSNGNHTPSKKDIDGDYFCNSND